MMLDEEGQNAACAVFRNSKKINLSPFSLLFRFFVSITVNDYTALWEMIRNDYGGRLVDILDVVAIVNIILGNHPNHPAADLNEDGEVNVQDVIIMVNIILE